MPDQPDDPINYDMKIPPEKKENKPEAQQCERSFDEVAAESDAARQRRRENEKPTHDLPSE